MATKLAATLPLAPARFSTTTGWPSVSPTMRPITRVSVSVVPPAGLPTTMVMGRPWAVAWKGAVAVAASSSAARPARRVNRKGMLSPGLWGMPAC
ncbi:hypothetical protein [Pseudorhodoferax aquiterrae]|uniref:hypothetical protein n=1 Tax=Pseudorhodoferax aquiterrae TaxID=747304 RepID=UPI001E2911A2|nr:hypothetical protein [Pseudorhodoferax aquiterrae]